MDLTTSLRKKVIASYLGSQAIMHLNAQGEDTIIAIDECVFLPSFNV